MHITQEMRQQACEGLLHFTPKKTLARELGVSVGSIRAWAFISSTVSSIGSIHAGLSCSKAPSITGFEHYPIGYSDVAKQFA